MKAKVTDRCIGCGSCVAITDSEVFDFNDDGLAECILNEIPTDKEEETKEAIKSCPTSAIEEE